MRIHKQAHLGMWDLRRLASVDSKSLNMVQDAQHTHWNVPQRKITTLQSKMLEKFAKTRKNGNDLPDLDIDLVTLRSLEYVDLDYTYL